MCKQFNVEKIDTCLLSLLRARTIRTCRIDVIVEGKFSWTSNEHILCINKTSEMSTSVKPREDFPSVLSRCLDGISDERAREKGYDQQPWAIAIQITARHWEKDKWPTDREGWMIINFPRDGHCGQIHRSSHRVALWSEGGKRETETNVLEEDWCFHIVGKWS